MLSAEAVKRKKTFMVFQEANSVVTCHDEHLLLKPVPDTGGLVDLHGNFNHAIVCAANYAGHCSGRWFDLISAIGGGVIPPEVRDEQNYAI